MCGRLAVFERASIAAAVLAATLGAATTASAASPPPRPLAMWQQWSRAHAAGEPAFTAFATVFMVAGPREVRIAGKRYEMDVTVFATPGGGSAQPPFASIDLQRSAPRGHPTAFQLHEYAFAPQSGTAFTFQRDSLDTSLDLGATIAPSQLAATFTPTSPVAKRRCTLITGGHGYLRQATGTMSYTAFSIATPTTPFFGTLTTGPVQAGEAFDPGCKGTIVIRLVSPRVTSPARRCAGRESLTTATATEEWAFEKVYGRREATQLVGTGTDPNTQPVDSESHAIIAETTSYDLPRPAHGPNGATAKVFASGDPFMSGSATFTSTQAPAVTGGHTCVAGGKTRHFSTVRYAGRLVPDTNVLTAGLDTGDVALTSRHATLLLRRYR